MRVQPRIEVSRGLGRQDQREAELAAFGGEARQQAEAAGPVGFVEHNGMSDSGLDTAPEHLLVDVVEREHHHGSLHAVVLGGMDSEDRRCIRRQQTPNRTARLEDAVVIESVEPDEDVMTALASC